MQFKKKEIETSAIEVASTTAPLQFDFSSLLNIMFQFMFFMMIFRLFNQLFETIGKSVASSASI
jgi:hypothetical protein